MPQPIKFNNTTNIEHPSYTKIEYIQGPTGFIGKEGDMGYQGITGPTGNMGAIGDIGPIGPVGMTGLKGKNGFRGSKGANGPTGPTGPTQEYLSNYFVINTNTLSFTLPLDMLGNEYIEFFLFNINENVAEQQVLTSFVQNYTTLDYTIRSTYKDIPPNVIHFPYNIKYTVTRNWIRYDKNTGTYHILIPGMFLISYVIPITISKEIAGVFHSCVYKMDTNERMFSNGIYKSINLFDETNTQACIQHSCLFSSNPSSFQILMYFDSHDFNFEANATIGWDNKYHTEDIKLIIQRIL